MELLSGMRDRDGGRVMDLISRQAVLDALDKPLVWTDDDYELGMKNQYESDVANIKALPTAHDYSTDEWCAGCKEYDHEKHCCPRFNRVIRETVEETQERKKGEWVLQQTQAGESQWRCSECSAEIFTHDGKHKIIVARYCYQCGAKMDVLE